MFNDEINKSLADLDFKVNKLIDEYSQLKITLFTANILRYSDPENYPNPMFVVRHDLDALAQKLGIEFKEEPAKKLYIEK